MESKVAYVAGPITTMRTDPAQDLRDANEHIEQLRKQLVRMNAERNAALMREDQLAELSQRLSKRLGEMRQERDEALNQRDALAAALPYSLDDLIRQMPEDADPFEWLEEQFSNLLVKLYATLKGSDDGQQAPPTPPAV